MSALPVAAFPPDQFLTVEQVARVCHAPEATVKYWLHLKRLPSYKVGRRRLVDRDVLFLWIRNNGRMPSEGAK